MPQKILVHVRDTGPVNTAKNRKKDNERPVNPPSKLEGIPVSYLPKVLFYHLVSFENSR